MSSSHRDAHPYGRSADDVRRRDQRLRRTRRLRVTQLVVFSALAIALVLVGVYAFGEFRRPSEDPGEIAVGASPTAEDSALVCPQEGDTPADPADVTVRVLNGTSRSGLAGSVTEELGERGFATDKPGNTGSASGAVTIVHGPEGYLAAAAVAAQFRAGDVTPELKLDEKAEGTTVEVLLGDGYRELAAAKKAAAALKEPVAIPEGC